MKQALISLNHSIHQFCSGKFHGADDEDFRRYASLVESNYVRLIDCGQHTPVVFNVGVIKPIGVI
jgi:hypothetical protein